MINEGFEFEVFKSNFLGLFFEFDKFIIFFDFFGISGEKNLFLFLFVLLFIFPFV